MGIEANFNRAAIQEYLSGKLDRFDELILRNLNYLGMECVTIAKNLDTYVDRTANLRNSIGYVVVKNGRIKYQNFSSDTSATESSQENGEQIGRDFAKELAQGFTEGYTLIVVAGMKYASYVEDVHHLDVLKPAENYAESNISEIAKSIVNSMKNAL